MLSETELAQLFVNYAETNKKAELIEEQIKAEMLLRQESQKMAGVEAKYYQEGHETPDYENTAKASMPKNFDLSPYSTTKTTTKWKEVCEAIGVEAPMGEPTPARVLVSMIKAKTKK